MSAETPRTDEAVRGYLFATEPKLSPLATPLTDRAAAFVNFSGGLVTADFARTLERELAEAKATIVEVAKGNVQFHGVIRGESAEKLLAERDTLRAEVAELEQQALDNAEDWAMCGIPHGSLLEKSLVLSDANRKLTAKVALLEADKARLIGTLWRWKEFIDEAVVAEDRSNLDGDNAETVLSQINEGAEEMLALLTPEDRQAIDQARTP
jgi:hypothetical protein